MSVPKIWHTSSKRHQSLPVRDSLETSRLPTIPTSPNATELRTRSNPSRRAEAMAALDPRSPSTISTCSQRGHQPRRFPLDCPSQEVVLPAGAGSQLPVSEEIPDLSEEGISKGQAEISRRTEAVG